MTIAAIIAALEAAGVAKEVVDKVTDATGSMGEEKNEKNTVSEDDVFAKIRVANEINIQYSANLFMLAKTNEATHKLANGEDVDSDKVFDMFHKMSDLFKR